MSFTDRSNGYEGISEDFIAVRSADANKAAVKAWASSLPKNCCVVDIGAGYGEPLTSVLVETGLNVWAIDAAPSMVAAFRQRFPKIEIACEAAETSSFFDRKFDAALVIGLLFLLAEDAQRQFIKNLATALVPGGSVLISAPKERGSWEDILTKRTSYSLGAETYTEIFAQNEFDVLDMYEDDQGTHYYAVRKR